MLAPRADGRELLDLACASTSVCLPATMNGSPARTAGYCTGRALVCVGRSDDVSSVAGAFRLNCTVQRSYLSCNSSDAAAQLAAEMLAEGATNVRDSYGGFHFSFQSIITQRHLPALTVIGKSAKCFYWMLLGDAGCRIRRTENPRVGGSIPPLATIQ